MEPLNLPIEEDYRPEFTECDNLIYMCLRYTIQWKVRPEDQERILKTVGPRGSVKGEAGIRRIVEKSCKYAWKILNKPKDPSYRDFEEHMRPYIEKFYTLTEKKRNNIKEIEKSDPEEEEKEE